MLNLKKKGDPENGARGSSARWLTRRSPRTRISWGERQSWVMSTIQRGIILSKHGSPANTHMVRGFERRDIIFELSPCVIPCREEGASAQMCGSQSAFQIASILLDESYFLPCGATLQYVFGLILYNFSSWTIIHRLSASNTMQYSHHHLSEDAVFSSIGSMNIHCCFRTI